LISLKEIKKYYGNVKAVDGISIDVPDGSIFGVVGPDGAGKTTLLRIIAATLKKDSGKYDLSGKDTVDNPEIVHKIIGYMPQRFALYNDLSLLENITFYAEIFGIAEKKLNEKIDEILSSFSIDQFKERLAGRLSGGMKQKLALACTLIHSPKLLVLDEPTNGVDPVSRREFWNILYDLREKGTTIVVSTSYLEEAERCNEVIMLHDGKILKHDDPGALKKSVPGRFYEVESTQLRRCERDIKKSFPEFEVILAGEKLKIFVPQDIDFEKRKKDMDGKCMIDNIRSSEPTLEDVFRYYSNTN